MASKFLTLIITNNSEHPFRVLLGGRRSVTQQCPHLLSKRLGKGHGPAVDTQTMTEVSGASCLSVKYTFIGLEYLH